MIIGSKTRQISVFFSSFTFDDVINDTTRPLRREGSDGAFMKFYFHFNNFYIEHFLEGGKYPPPFLSKENSVSFIYI